MPVPTATELLSRERSEARNWTCEVSIWRRDVDSYGASVEVGHEGEPVIALTAADGVARDFLSDRLELASSALGAPPDIVQACVARAGAEADRNGWGSDT